MAWWLWMVLGLALLLVELVTPSGFYVMFFGIGALAVGLFTALGVPGTAMAQWMAFTVLSVALVLGFRLRLQARRPIAPDTIDTLVGEVALPREPIAPGQVGRVELRGAVWSARNITPSVIDAGRRCRVTGVDGLIVFVQPE